MQLQSFVGIGAMFFFLLLGSCSSKVEKANPGIKKDSISQPLLAHDSTWKTYIGTIPCADCPGIKMELKLKDNFTIESYQYELTETYLEAENGKDKSIATKGMYNFWRGNTKDPDATVIVLNDDSVESAKRFFLRVNEEELKLVNNKGDETESQLNFSLKLVLPGNSGTKQ